MRATIQDWTDAQVLLKFDEHREVKYCVYREGEALYQEICCRLADAGENCGRTTSCFFRQGSCGS